MKRHFGDLQSEVFHPFSDLGPFLGALFDL